MKYKSLERKSDWLKILVYVLYFSGSKLFHHPDLDPTKTTWYPAGTPGVLITVAAMVLILDGNLAHVAHACRKIGLFGEKKKPICDCSRTIYMP